MMRVVFLPTAALALVGHKVSLPRAAPRQAADIASLDVSSLDPAVLGGVVAAVGAAAVLAGKGGDGAAAPAAAKATAAKVETPAWSGDASARRRPAGPARSFSSAPPAAVQGCRPRSCGGDGRAGGGQGEARELGTRQRATCHAARPGPARPARRRAAPPPRPARPGRGCTRRGAAL